MINNRALLHTRRIGRGFVRKHCCTNPAGADFAKELRQRHSIEPFQSPSYGVLRAFCKKQARSGWAKATEVTSCYGHETEHEAGILANSASIRLPKIVSRS